MLPQIALQGVHRHRSTTPGVPRKDDQELASRELTIEAAPRLIERFELLQPADAPLLGEVLCAQGLPQAFVAGAVPQLAAHQLHMREVPRIQKRQDVEKDL